MDKKPKIKCECGVEYLNTSKPTHVKSRRHLIYAQMELAKKIKSNVIEK